jgi:hypothetical protein
VDAHLRAAGRPRASLLEPGRRTNIYTVHDVNALLAKVVLPRIGSASQYGLTWYYTRPPIIGIEYEMDLRGGTRETILQAGQ